MGIIPRKIWEIPPAEILKSEVLLLCQLNGASRKSDYRVGPRKPKRGNRVGA